jgi:hypothetical protein
MADQPKPDQKIDQQGQPLDEHFFDRADEYIRLANQQCREIDPSKVSASFMYGLARFHTWLTAASYGSKEELKARRVETMTYFMQQYKAMLEENWQDYVDNFDQYIPKKKPN